MRTRDLVRTMSLLFPLLAACEPPEAADVSTTEQTLYTHPGVQLWPTGTAIPVCWTTAGLDAEKAIIQNAVRSTWEAYGHIAFSWESGCPSFGLQKYVRVLVTPATDTWGGGSAIEGTAALQWPSPGSSSRSLHIAVPGNGHVGRLEYLAVHEFGHVLGFSHEQDRDDDGNACPGGSVAGTNYTAYDHDSVMNYCNSAGNISGRLSLADKVGMVVAYGQSYAAFGYHSPLGGVANKIATAVNADGRVQVFAIGTDDAVHTNAELAPGGGWSGWSGLWGDVVDIAAAVNIDGRIQIFAIGSDGAVHTNAQTTPGGAWSGWSGLGGWVSRISIVRNADGRLQLFAIGSDSAVHTNAQTTPGGAWSGWSGLGGWGSELAAAVNADGRIQVFTIGDIGDLRTIAQTSPAGAWGAWTSFGGWMSRIATAMNEDGTMQVFVVGSDNALHSVAQTTPGGAWTGWHGLGGWMTDIATTVDRYGRIEVFAIGPNNTAHVIRQTVEAAAWGVWEPVRPYWLPDASSALQIAPTARPNGGIEVVMLQPDRSIVSAPQLTP